MTLRVSSPSVKPVGRTLSGSPGEPDRARPTYTSGAEYLRSRAREQAVPELDPIRPAIRKWIRDERVERRGGVASVYHLVPRQSAAAYRAALSRAGKEHGTRVLVTGPWPAYAFASPW